ncbi:adenylyl cyclase X E-like isoform 2-T2 [Glossina fuscipes fuscipes]
MDDIFRISGNYANLKGECVDMGLEEVYQNYLARIYNNYLNTFTIIHIIITLIHSITLYNVHQEEYFPYEIYMYLIGAGIICAILRIYAKQAYTRQLIKLIVSWTTALIIAFCDISLNLYYISQAYIVRPSYAAYVISTIYLFLPLPGFYHPIILSCVISLIYGADFLLITAKNATINLSDVTMVTPEIFFLIGLNIIGVTCRWRREIITRLLFLTKRQSVEQAVAFKYAKDQEKNLLVSIIPEPIAKKIGQEVRNRIERSKVGQQGLYEGRTFFVEPHEDVSIIFADLVNFTFLTTKLDVKTLVETLHDLFQRFDKACQDFNVMRIKFLGDCYYAVSGIPVSHPLHGVCCIELGRAIVAHVREVRTVRNLDVDMRIGIHSGSLLAGIIGSSKWQYDVWSTDVNIANCLETTGIPGRVHISKATLNLTEDFYIYEEGTEQAKTHPILLKYKIKTFLIIEPSVKMNTSIEWQNYLESKKEAEETTPSIDIEITPNEPKQMVYQEIVEKANELMEIEVGSLPICKLQFYRYCFERPRHLTADQIEEYRAESNISSIGLLFGNWSWEFKYLTYRTEFFKHYALVTFPVLLCVVAMQATKEQIQNTVEFWIICSLMILCNIAVIVFIWRKYLIRRIFRWRPIRKYIRRAPFKLRTITCDSDMLANDDKVIFLLLEEGIRKLCFNSWAVTESLCLYVALAFTWPLIPITLSFLMTVPLLIIYSIGIYTHLSLNYESSVSTNITTSAELAHVWVLLIIWFLYMLISRHLIFISKLNYFNERQLQRRIDSSSITNESIRALLLNILPAHVVQVYLTKRLKNEPYYEKHEYVAVMFATVIHEEAHLMDLRLMNEIMCDFDEVLKFYKFSEKVEKIKVINWTYMVACGLGSRRGYLPQSLKRDRSPFTPHEKESRRTIRKRSSHIFAFVIDKPEGNNVETNEQFPSPLLSSSNSSSSSISSEDESDRMNMRFMRNKKGVVYVLANFAVEFLKVIRSINSVIQESRSRGTPPLELRIGISSGEVMAGVVGSSQAHYDIWGNAVNMAARMDTTGEPGYIQVTEETAEILRDYNVSCTYRGLIDVKGRGEIPTYFIDVDDQFKFGTI